MQDKLKEIEDLVKLFDGLKKVKRGGVIKLERTDMDNESNKYICGIDYATSKDMTVGINFNSKKFNKDLTIKIKEVIEEHKKNIGDYIQCSYE